MNADNRGCTCPKFVPSNAAMPSLAYDPNCPLHGSGNGNPGAANATVTLNYSGPFGNNAGTNT